MVQAICSCFLLLMHLTPRAAVLAWPSAGSNMAASMAIMAMTTSNSINVNARLYFISKFYSRLLPRSASTDRGAANGLLRPNQLEEHITTAHDRVIGGGVADRR